MRRSPEDLQEQLRIQIGYLRKSAMAYDEGDVHEAPRLATTLRVLLHDTKRSHSLLDQLCLKDKHFLDASSPRPSHLISSYAGLVGIPRPGTARRYIPNFDVYEARPRPFDEWWHGVIIEDLQQRTITREQLVRTMADQDGGAHVDPELDDIYAEVARTNVMGHEHNVEGRWQPFADIEKASVRQVAHEVLGTLEQERPIPEQTAGNMHGMTLRVSGLVYAIPPVGRNHPCPCGSGKKYKRCHGRAATGLHVESLL